MMKVKHWTKLVITLEELKELHKERCKNSGYRKYANDHNMWHPDIREEMISLCVWQDITWEINASVIVIKD